MKRSKLVALCAISTGFAILFLTAGVFIPILDYSGIFMASLCTMIPLTKKSFKGGILTFLATLCLSLIFFVGMKPEMVLTYGIFFGAHPAVSYILREKKVNNLLSMAIKTIWFVGSLLLIYTLFSAFLFEDTLLNNEIFKKYAYLILSVVGAFVFVCYDLLITHFQKALDKTIEKLKL